MRTAPAKSPFTRRLRRRAALGAAVLAVAGLTPAAAHGASVSTTAYEGLAAWIDVFDAGPWERPESTVRGLARRGVATLFVQTGNSTRPSALHRPDRLARILASAHRHGLQVVAWYLPTFTNPRRDWQRVRAAVRFRSPSGRRFDGFALDIEATAVRDIAVRNRRMLALSDRLRHLVEDRYPLGAIIPDPVSQRYWPRFPYRQVAGRYDAILPMSYWTMTSRGQARVHRRTCRGLRIIRARIRDASVPIHVIGGLADRATTGEVRGFTRAATACGAVGGSLYDAPITREAHWRSLAPLARLRAAA
jgi:hypothetical protein